MSWDAGWTTSVSSGWFGGPQALLAIAPAAPALQVLPRSGGGKRRLPAREEARRHALRREEEDLLLTLH